MLAAEQDADVFPLAAFCLLAENPHRGHRLPTAARHRGFTPTNSNTATGFQAFLYDSGRRSRSTGKERDAESGLDYFGARYFSGAQGRWTSADWSAKPEAVPYSTLDDPQTLNLFGCLRDNPLDKADGDGHADCGCVPFGAAMRPAEAGRIANAIEDVAQQGWNNFKSNAALITAAVTMVAKVVYQVETKSKANSDAPPSSPSSTSPPLPSGLVGTYYKKSGPQGRRHNSGPLDPAHGGTGDAAKDFGALTGGKSGPAQAGSGRPPGTEVGDNGVALRPATQAKGPRIDIPANDAKPAETLHYPNK